MQLRRHLRRQWMQRRQVLGTGFGRLPDESDGAAVTTTASLDLQELIGTMKAVRNEMDALTDRALRGMMAEHGFSPDEGGVVYLPESMRHEFFGTPPGYVRFHPFIMQPLICKEMSLSWEALRA
jgi:hypothetical protein